MNRIITLIAIIFLLACVNPQDEMQANLLGKWELRDMKLFDAAADTFDLDGEFFKFEFHPEGYYKLEKSTYPHWDSSSWRMQDSILEFTYHTNGGLDTMQWKIKTVNSNQLIVDSDDRTLIFHRAQ